MLPPRDSAPFSLSPHAVQEHRAWAARQALQHELLQEYHRLLGEAAVAEWDDLVAAAVLRRRAWVWRATALRIPDVPTSRYPRWLLDHLERSSAVPVVGDEYRRVREVVAAHTVAHTPDGPYPGARA